MPSTSLANAIGAFMALMVVVTMAAAYYVYNEHSLSQVPEEFFAIIRTISKQGGIPAEGNATTTQPIRTTTPPVTATTTITTTITITKTATEPTTTPSPALTQTTTTTTTTETYETATTETKTNASPPQARPPIDVAVIRSFEVAYTEREFHATVLNRSIVGISGLCSDCVLLVHARIENGKEAYLLAYGNYILYHEEDEEEVKGIVSATDLYQILPPGTTAKFRVLDAGVEQDGYRLYLVVEIEMLIDGEKVEFYASGS